MLKWGIIGCGGVARNVIAPGIELSNNGVLHAVGSRTDENAKSFAAAFDVEHAYGSYEALLDDPDVQAVYIALPNALHMSWTIKAAARGKHVLCDKQLALNAEEASAMVDACRQHNVQLMEAVFYRFHPQTQAIKKLVDEGRIGQLTRFSAMHSTTMPASTNIRLDPSLGGGVMGDTGCYCIDAARFHFDAEPTHASAIVEFGDTGVDERVTATLTFPEGRVAQFECSYRLEAGVYIQSYELFGQRGHIYAPMGYAQVETYREGTIMGSSYYVGDDRAVKPQTQAFHCEPVHQWQLGLEYFADRILQGEPIGRPTENGLANVRVIDAVFKSVREKRTVAVAS